MMSVTFVGVEWLVVRSPLAGNAYSVRSLALIFGIGRFRLNALPRWQGVWHSEMATLALRTSAANTRTIINASKGSVSIKDEKSLRVTKPTVAPFFATALIEYGSSLTSAGKPRIELGGIATLAT